MGELTAKKKNAKEAASSERRVWHQALINLLLFLFVVFASYIAAVALSGAMEKMVNTLPEPINKEHVFDVWLATMLGIWFWYLSVKK